MIRSQISQQVSLRALVKQNLPAYLKGTLWLLIIDLLGFTFPYLVKVVIDRLQNRPLPQWMPTDWAHLGGGYFLICISLLYIGVAAFVAHGRYWWRVYFIWSTFPVASRMREKVFAHIHAQPLSFFKSRKVGNLLSALSSDSENMRMLLAIGALMLVDALINFIFFPIILSQLSASLTLIVIPPLLLTAGIAIFWSDRLSIYYERVQEITAQLSAQAFELASGIRVLKAFRREQSFHNEFVRESRRLKDASMKVAQFQTFFVPGLDFALGLGMVLAVIFGGLRVIEGTMALSDFVAFQLYIAHLDWPMMALGWFIQMYRSAKASEKRVHELTEVAPSIHRETELKRIPFDAHFDLRIENLSLAFDQGRHRLFENLNFQIPAHSWIGVTGPVGVGKSLLLELLSRQRDPDRGAVFFRGQNLRTLDPAEIMRQILYIPQETFLFSRSLKRNLTLGLEGELKDPEIWELLEALRFDQQMLLDRGGLDVKLGERGVNLSGGQKQRLSLGRALLRRRDVYLFDDLFSHVDAETEAHLLNALRKYLPQGATVVLVSQRLETLLQCSQILVLKELGIESYGPAQEVLRTSGFLRELHQIQNILSQDLVMQGGFRE